MKYKEWKIPTYNDNEVTRLSKELGVSRVLSKLLIGRRITSKEKADAFLKKDFSAFHSPFLMKDVELGAKIIIDAIEKNEKILIWGDYDVDGVTSVTVLLKYIRSIGGNCDYYIPKRSDDGYGLNSRVFSEYAKAGFKLLITVDSGITALSEVALAKELGMRVIITDHHECKEELPRADAVINPKRPDCHYPFEELAGVGVVFKVICAVEMLYSGVNSFDAAKKLTTCYSDFVATGTIADVMPIAEENRVIVNCGLKLLENTKNKGLAALIHEAGIDTSNGKSKKITSTTVGFVLAPRINAAGRMDTSKIAVDLFMTDSYEEAASLASTLTKINKERQLIENDILNSALEKINSQCDLQKDKVIILDDEEWHHGIIGIVSSRITEKYNLPSILISFRNDADPDNHDIGKGSARSVKGMNLVDALTDSSPLLQKFGGHELAAGLSVKRDNLPEFKKRMNDFAKKTLDPSLTARKVEIDCEVSSTEVSLELAGELSYLEPFGLCNPVPLFCMTDIKITQIFAIGNGKHTKITLEKDGISHTALLFGTPTASFQMSEGDLIDVAFNLDINYFRSQPSVQLIVRDVRPAKRENDVLKQHLYKTELMLYSPEYPIKLGDIPTRNDFAEIYSGLRGYLQSFSEQKTVEVYLPYLTKLCNKKFSSSLPLFKTLIIFKVLSEEGIISIDNADDLCKNVKITATSKKINLEDTKIIKNLYSKVR